MDRSFPFKSSHPHSFFPPPSAAYPSPTPDTPLRARGQSRRGQNYYYFCVMIREKERWSEMKVNSAVRGRCAGVFSTTFCFFSLFLNGLFLLDCRINHQRHLFPTVWVMRKPGEHEIKQNCREESLPFLRSHIHSGAGRWRVRHRFHAHLGRPSVLPAGGDMSDDAGVALLAHVDAVHLDDALTRMETRDGCHGA